MIQQHPYLQVERPMIFAHRGDSVHAPANTKPAFTLAVELGADALETDIHWTRDGHIVVCHDDTVDSMSNGSGYIRDMTLGELRKLDFGYTFTPDEGKTFPFRGNGVQIMTLEELLFAFPNVRVNMDIKPKQPGSLRQLIELIYECRAEWRVMLASFHSSSLQQVRGMAPRLATSASTMEVAGFWSAARLGLPQSKVPYQAFQVPVNIGLLKVITPGFVERAHRVHADVHAWTIDDEVQIRELFNLGVDGIVTNDPALAVQVRNDGFADSKSAVGGSMWRF